MKYLIDTNILIDHLRGDTKVTAFLENIERGEIRAAVSVITEYELLASKRLTETEEEKILQLLGLTPILNVTSSLARKAAYFHRTYQTDFVDALIAATAFRAKATLLTRNIKHFRNIKEIRIESI